MKILSGDGLYLLKWPKGNKVHYAYWTDEPLDEPLADVTVPPRGAFGYDGRRIDVRNLALSGEPVYLEAEPSQSAAFEASFLPAARRAYARRSAPVREEVRIKKFSGDWKSVDFTQDDSCFALGGRRADVMPPDPTVEWSGADDLSARTLLGWDDGNFYFFAAVKDDVHCVPKTGNDIYMNDAVQLAFDPKDNAKKNAGYLPDDCEFGLCEGQKLFAWRRPGVFDAGTVEGDFVRIVRSGDITEYRAAIPWRMMGLDAAPKTFGIAFAILDNDNNDRARYYLAFGNGIADGKRPARFKRAVLVDEKEESK